MSTSQPVEGRCAAKTRGGGYCEKYPMRGASRCRNHGAGAPQSRRAAARVVKREEAMKEIDRLVKRAGVDSHPIEHLLDSLYRAAAQVEVYGRMIADLDNAGEIALEAPDGAGRLRGWAVRRVSVEAVPGAEVEVDGETGETRIATRVVTEIDHDPLLVQQGEDRVALHPFVKEYNDALERRAKFAKLALDAGVEERRVQLAEAQASLLAGAIRSILTELGVKQDRRVVRVVQAELRKLSGGVT